MSATPEKIDVYSLDTFTRAYIECLLWSSHDMNDQDPDGGDALDADYDFTDFSQDALRLIKDDCDAFQKDNAELLARAGSAEQNGYDFWLTRNRHGAGFWDRGYPSDVATPLTDAAHVYGGQNPYVTDGGEVSL